MSEVMQSIQRVRVPSRYDAKRAFREYTKACELQPDMSEYADLAEAYRVMARGGEVLHLGQAMSAAGFNAGGLPKLAVVRADAKEVVYESDFNFHYFKMRPGASHLRGRPKTVKVPRGLSPGDDRRYRTARAVAPLIPPRCLPKHGLANYYLLWEAVWVREVPRDPILMRHVSGFIYQPLFQWDLTDLERMVLTSRLIKLGTN